MKIEISVECHGSSTDLRITGSNLATGCKAVYLENGKKRTNKIYMTNTGKSLGFYVKNKGRNVMLQTEDVVYQLHSSDLTCKPWFIEKEA